MENNKAAAEKEKRRVGSRARECKRMMKLENENERDENSYPAGLSDVCQAARMCLGVY